MKAPVKTAAENAVAPDGPSAATRRPAPPVPPGTRLLALGGRSVLVPVRPLLGCTVLLLVVVAVTSVCLAVGETNLDPVTALRAALGDGTARDVLLVEKLRLP
ncbi:hypothetical protein ACFU6K_36830, partial [Kitasatospora sp. NPDC057512]